jgi:hypothetical protein
MREEFKKFAHDFAQKNAFPHPFQSDATGYEWLVGFIKRHSDITLRSPEPTSVSRARRFSYPQVTCYTLSCGN